MAARTLLLTLASLAIAAALTPASRAAAQGLTAATIEFSAQAKPEDKNKNKNKTQNVQQQKKVEQKKIEHNKKIEVKKEQRIKKIEVKKEERTKKLEEKKNKIDVDKKLTGTPKNTVKQKFTGKPKKFEPKKKFVNKFKLKDSKQAFVHGRNYSVFRRDYRVRYHNRWRTFVALGVLAPLLIGAYEYYPYAFMDVPGNYCEGQTEDGCELVYDEVETLEGDVVPQCVAYCPWQ